MIHEGDVFITKLERGFFGAFRVIRTGGYFDFIKGEFYLIAITPYIDTVKPDISNPQLKEALCEKRFYCHGIPNINIYSGKNIEKHFEYLGNIPLTKEEAKQEIKIGDGKHIEEGGGFPLRGTDLKDFGFEAYLEWRWEHERDAVIREQQEREDTLATAAKQARTDALKSAITGERTMEAYRYIDEKSNKFWRIEYAGPAFAVNYGKTGTIGKYQVKEFRTQKECEKEAKKLIAAKIRKGYQLYPEFDTEAHLYLDDEETGLHPLTSHPNFRAHFTDEFYYSCVDEEAPFGSDEGSDTLAQIAEDIRKNKAFDFTSFPRKLFEEYWGMTYLPAVDISREAVERLVKEEEPNLTQSDMVTFATAFAQIKITGHVDAELKAAALKSMRRMEIAAEVLGWNTTGQPSETIEKMIYDLERFA